MYTSDHNPNVDDIHKFLSTIHLPHPTQEQVEKLNKPQSPEEFCNALNRIPNNKAPGPDGFPAEFYKHFWTTISPLFLRMIDELTISSKIPPTLNSAMITLLLKPNKDPTDPASYRSLSLINTDMKITSKTLASTIEGIIPKWKFKNK